jgi:predicted esterase
MKGLLPLDHSSKLLKTIKPMFSYLDGDDINAFQTQGRNMLKDLLGISEIESKYTKKPISITYDGYANDLNCREIQFVVESENDVFVPCHLLLPIDSYSSPLLIALHGHSTGVHVCLGRAKYPIDNDTIENQECDFAKQAINNGYAVLALEHRGFGDRGGDENGAKCTEIAFRSMMLGRTLIGERVWDSKIALDAVIDNFAELFCKDKIICLGYSGGGTIATYLSAIDYRIKFATIVSAISSVASSIGAMPHCACNYVPSIAKYFDVGNICQLIAPRNLIVVSGKEDPIFPASSAIECVNVAKSAFNQYEADDKLAHILANGGHKFYPTEVWDALKKLM